MIEEGKLITIDTGGRYVLLHDLDIIEGKRYFYAVGVNDDDTLNENDVLFFEVKNADTEKPVVIKVDPTSDLYKTLTAIEFIDSKIYEDPSFEKELEKFVASVDELRSSN